MREFITATHIRIHALGCCYLAKSFKMGEDPAHRVVALLLPAEMTTDDKENQREIPVVPVVVRLVVASGKRIAQEAGASTQRGKYAMRTEQEKACILEFVDYFQESMKVSLDAAVALVEQRFQSFGKISPRSVRDWRATASLRRHGAEENEEEQAETRGRPSLVPDDIRDQIKARVRTNLNNAYACLMAQLEEEQTWGTKVAENVFLIVN